jgi:hypothetical protein
MKEAKPTNPKDAVGIAKVPVSCIPMTVLGELGLALMEGARKYGRANWRKSGVRYSVYYDAVWRHMGAWWEGQDLDPDSGRSHLVKAIASLTVLLDSIQFGNAVDDRPIRPTDQDWMTKLNAGAAELLKRYPECKPPCTEKDKLQ